MASSIADLILEILAEHPDWDNATVAEEVKRREPGARTSPASVSSVKSRAKIVPRSLGSGEQLWLPVDMPVAVSPTQNDAWEREVRIKSRFATLRRVAKRVAKGELPSLIVSGPPGLGKSHSLETVLTELREEDGYDIIKGTIAAPGLYLALYEQRDRGVVVLDDCDDVFRDETCLNILKAVLDSSGRRRVSYRKRAHWMQEMDVPTSFVFEGSVAFCTNVDFEEEIASGRAMANHYSALLDRCPYLHLTMRTEQDMLCHMRQVGVEGGLLEEQGLTRGQAEEVFSFVEANADRFYGLSIRLLIQAAAARLHDPDHWRDDLSAMKMRTL